MENQDEQKENLNEQLKGSDADYVACGDEKSVDRHLDAEVVKLS